MTRKAKVWPITVYGKTTGMNGKSRRIKAVIEGAGDAKGAVLRFVLAKKNAWEWYGVEVIGVTQLGQTVKVLVERPESWENTSGFEYNH